MLDADGNLYAGNCYYCGRGPELFPIDYLHHPVCHLCWPSVLDTLSRWGDLRGLGRGVTEADRQVPRGAWTAAGNASGDKTEKPPAGEGGREAKKGRAE